MGWGERQCVCLLLGCLPLTRPPRCWSLVLCRVLVLCVRLACDGFLPCTLKTDAARLEALEAEEQRRLLAASKDDTVKTSGIINKKALNFNKTVTEEVHKREVGVCLPPSPASAWPLKRSHAPPPLVLSATWHLHPHPHPRPRGL